MQRVALLRPSASLSAVVAVSIVTMMVASTAEAAPRLSMSGLGAVKFGMTITQAKRVAPVKLTGRNYACAFWSWRSLPTGTVQMLATRGSSMDLVSVYRRGVRTTRGVQVGDSLDNVRVKYPTLRMFSYPIDEGGTYYAVTGRYRGQTMMMRFSEQAGRITAMTVGLRSVAEHFYECS